MIYRQILYLTKQIIGLRYKPLITFIVVIVCFGCSKSNNVEEPIEHGIAFEDHFNQTDGIPNPEHWSLCKKSTSTWSKHLSESYDQAFVEDGKLILVAEIIDGEYKTGGIRSLGKVDFKYGKVEISARLVKTAQGGFPALWMMPSDNVYGGSPRSGEIDIMEQLNHETQVYQTIHSHYRTTLGYNDPTPFVKAEYKENEFNTYGIEWSPETIIFSINGAETFRYPNLHLKDETEKLQWPFDHNFHMILNYSLGGEGTWPGEINDSELPTRMEVDWVKVSPLNN